jgi:hypothetical protein
VTGDGKDNRGSIPDMGRYTSPLHPVSAFALGSKPICFIPSVLGAIFSEVNLPELDLSTHHVYRIFERMELSPSSTASEMVLNYRDKFYMKFIFFLILSGAGIAQSVMAPATGWTTEGSEFEFR